VAPPAKGKTAAPPPPPPAPVVVAPPPPPPNFIGLIDEFQISKVMRPLGAIALAVKNQGPQADLLTLGTPEESSAFGSGYIGIILGSVTIDAWVVIGILGIMFALSWVVMIGKAVFLSGQRRANRAFHVAFRDAMARAEDSDSPLSPINPAAVPRLRGSPLFRIYQIAQLELEERLRLGRIGPDGALIPQSLAAIRAAMDAAFVMESQRLSRLMVLLTIAIAGGPFIGLLGTVIGVMITFAAIAAAGDVNVNAIAPGISAALLATVAGLAVAIPALFGYNYFTTRIREISAEMQIFLEDLVARMAEGVRMRNRPRAAE
jgi:biopolymer transport protein ExbB